MCYGTIAYSILLNETLVEFFHGSRGLRQGDPLSLFLFLIVAEAFGALLSKAFRCGLLEGFRVKENGVMVSHLQFTDNTLIMCKTFEESLKSHTLIMCKAFEEQVKYLRCVILCFEAVSNLKVNLHKSIIYRVGNVYHIDRLATCLGCSVGSLPTTYLSLPLRAPFKSIAHWNPVVSRIQKRLAG